MLNELYANSTFEVIKCVHKVIFVSHHLSKQQISICTAFDINHALQDLAYLSAT